jgi:hypothetical protein
LLDQSNASVAAFVASAGGGGRGEGGIVAEGRGEGGIVAEGRGEEEKGDGKGGEVGGQNIESIKQYLVSRGARVGVKNQAGKVALDKDVYKSMFQDYAKKPPIQLKWMIHSDGIGTNHRNAPVPV